MRVFEVRYYDEMIVAGWVFSIVIMIAMARYRAWLYLAVALFFALVAFLWADGFDAYIPRFQIAIFREANVTPRSLLMLIPITAVWFVFFIVFLGAWRLILSTLRFTRLSYLKLQDNYRARRARRDAIAAERAAQHAAKAQREKAKEAPQPQGAQRPEPQKTSGGASPRPGELTGYEVERPWKVSAAHAKQGARNTNESVRVSTSNRTDRINTSSGYSQARTRDLNQSTRSARNQKLVIAVTVLFLGISASYYSQSWSIFGSKTEATKANFSNVLKKHLETAHFCLTDWSEPGIFYSIGKASQSELEELAKQKVIKIIKWEPAFPGTKVHAEIMSEGRLWNRPSGFDQRNDKIMD